VILRSIVSLAHDLGMDVVAEGAETDSDAVELSQLGCEYAQGFVFGAPMTPEKARELLQADKRSGDGDTTGYGHQRSLTDH
jgi:EAL domain-containing protein (putative c-di-GMP-specific phosphodiesterase class I)